MERNNGCWRRSVGPDADLSPFQLDIGACRAIRIKTMIPAHGASSDAVDIDALTPFAAWLRRHQGEPVWRAICAGARIDPDVAASNGRSLPAGQFEAFLGAFRDHAG